MEELAPHVAVERNPSGNKASPVVEVDPQKNNGNLIRQTVTVPNSAAAGAPSNAFTAVQSYNYDKLNRITSAEEKIAGVQQWRQAYTFDRYGNRNFVHSQTTTLPRQCGTGNTLVCDADKAKYDPDADPLTNRLQENQYGDANKEYEYDAVGSTVRDAEGRRFVYDGENKQTEVRDSAGNIVGVYQYDGDGKRVKKVSFPGTTQEETTVFVYDASSKLIAEYSTNPVPASSAKVNYVTSDHLGSPRINTDLDGRVTARHDYMPYGEEVSRASYGVDSVRKKFTGYERDNESGLDFAEARYYSNQHGRFTSTDPILIKKDRLVDPQRVNLYAYVRNNPFKFVDITGEDLVLANRNARATFRQVMNGGLTQAERNNIRVFANGRVELRNPNAINTQNASYAYQQIAGIVGNRNLTINVYSVAQGQTAQGVSYQDASNSAGVTFGSPGDATRDVVIPVGGGVQVAGNPPGSGNRVATTEDTIFAHEVFGHANGNDGDDSITAENNYRRSRNPAIGERSGEDHRFEIPQVTGPAEIITTTPAQIQTTLSPRPLIPLPTPPPPPKKPEELIRD